MKKQVPEEKKVIWREEKRLMTLQQEPVLELALLWPEWTGRDALERSTQRYYKRLVTAWKDRWEKELYLRACCELSQKQEEKKPFSCWRAALGGKINTDSKEYLSIAMWAREDRGDGRVLEYRWGDTWRKEDGMPVTLKQLFDGEKKWRRKLRDKLQTAARECRGRDIFLDDGAEKTLLKWFSPECFALCPEGLEFYFPQCTIAPAVERAVALYVPCPGGNA